MTRLIEFLERVGSDSRLHRQDSEHFGRTMALAGIDDSARQAILAADQNRLEGLLGAAANVFCGLHAPDDDAPGEGETPPPPSEPDGSQRTAVRRKRSGKKKAGKKKKSSPKKKAPARKKKVSRKKAGKKKKKSSNKKASRKKK